MKLKKSLVALAFGVMAAASAYSGALSNYLTNHLVDEVVRGQNYTGPTTVYFALATSTGSAAACGTEETGTGYARVPYTSSLANWAGTQGAGTTAASSGTSGQTSTNTTVTFPSPTGSWGVVTSICIFDAATSGNLLLQTALTTSKTINSGDAAASIAPAAFSWTIN